MHSPLCSIPMDMKHLSGPNFTSNIQTSPPHIISWVQAPLSLIFTFKMNSYATWAISVFLQASMQKLFGNPTTVVWQDILALRKLCLFFRTIFIGQTFDRMSTSISDPVLHVSFPTQPSKSKAYTPLFLFLRSPGNPSQWITCMAYHPPRKEMNVYLLSLISFRRWPSSQPIKRMSYW
jgi:hypothetical protein